MEFRKKGKGGWLSTSAMTKKKNDEMTDFPVVCVSKAYMAS